jgi:hypothetical protein
MRRGNKDGCCIGHDLDSMGQQIRQQVALGSSLRRNENANGSSVVERAKSKTLKMTVTIVLAFLFCWTPYELVHLW